MPSNTSKNQRPAGLVILGALEVLFGGVLSLIAVLVSFIKDKLPAEQMKFVWVDVYLCLGLALLWVVLGIGSFMAKRWARALVLITAWSWLILGTVGFGISIYQWIFPDAAQTERFAALPPGTMTAIHVGMSLFMLFIGTVLPLILVLYYSRDKVREACEALDPGTSWVDGVPLPVLGLCLWMGLGAFLAFPIMAFFHFAMTLYGVVISGAVGGTVLFLFSVINFFLAWGFYRLRIEAWWGSLAFYAICSGSMFFYTQENMAELYRRMEMPMELVGKAMPSAAYYQCVGLGSILLVVGYLAFIKRYFKTARKKSR
jgi:hypothetical protein